MTQTETSKARIEPPIEVDTKGNPGIVRFETFAAAREWAHDQQTKWFAPNVFPFLKNKKHPALAGWTAALDDIDRATVLYVRTVDETDDLAMAQLKDPELRKENRKVIEGALSVYTEHRALHSESHEGQFIINGIPNKLGEWRAGAIMAAVGFPIADVASFGGGDQVIQQRLLGYAVLQGFRAPGTSEIAYRNQSLKDAEKIWDLRQLQAEEVTRQAKAEVGLASKDRENFATEHEAALKSHENRLAKIEADFTKRMGLQAPHLYWRDRAIWSTTVFVSFLVIFVVLAIAGPWYLFENADAVKAYLTDIDAVASPPGSAATPKSGLNFTLLGLAIIPTVAYFWILKHLARLFVSYSSTAIDAGQRAVMVKTFLALATDESQPINDSERVLILEALFRPNSTDGWDDGPPAALFEFFNKARK